MEYLPKLTSYKITNKISVRSNKKKMEDMSLSAHKHCVRRLTGTDRMLKERTNLQPLIWKKCVPLPIVQSTRIRTAQSVISLLSGKITQSLRTTGDEAVDNQTFSYIWN